MEDVLKGDPAVFLKMLHHLLFRASEKFTNHIQTHIGGKVHKDVKFMPDKDFFENVKLILCDLFAYRVKIVTP